MIQCRLEHSPIVYWVEKRAQSAQWVLFLHAAFVDHGMFDKQVAGLGDKYNLLLPDMIGHGDSIDAQKGDSIADMAVWLNAILDKEGIDKVHVVGVSLGAIVAQNFADRFAARVLSLACFGGYDCHRFDHTLQKKNGAAQMRMILKAMVSIKWFAKANKKISAYTQPAQEAFYAMNIRFAKRSLRYMAAVGALVNRGGVLPRTYSLLIGCGRHDIPMELAAIEQWKANEPQCQVIIFENAGHCVNMDEPQEFNRVLVEFWQQQVEARQ